MRIILHASQRKGRWYGGILLGGSSFLDMVTIFRRTIVVIALIIVVMCMVLVVVVIVLIVAFIFIVIIFTLLFSFGMVIGNGICDGIGRIILQPTIRQRGGARRGGGGGGHGGH